MSQHLVLLRHAESSKNTNPSFSATDGAEHITAQGMRQLAAIISAIDRYYYELRPSSLGIFSSPTQRSLATASEIANHHRVVSIDALRPIRSPYPGMSEADVAGRDPHFMTLITDYRNGLRSAYDIPRGGGEQIREFENRVAAGISEVLSHKNDLNVIVGHRSTITATLLRAARTLFDYPENWYGHVNVPLGSISLLSFNIDGVCCHIADLCSLTKADTGEG